MKLPLLLKALADRRLHSSSVSLDNEHKLLWWILADFEIKVWNYWMLLAELDYSKMDLINSIVQLDP